MQPECQRPHYNKHLHHTIQLTHYTIGHRGQLNTHYHPTNYPSSPQLTYDMTTDYNKTDGHPPITRKRTGHNSRKTESAFAQTSIPTNIHTASIIFKNIILMADKHNIPNGKMHSNFRLLPEDIVWFQRQQPTSGGTVRLSKPANYCQHILSNRFLDGFLDPSQFAVAKLTHFSSNPQRPSDFSRSWQCILLSGDVHPNPGPTTKYPWPVCARNVTGRGVSYLCNRCFGWVHSKYSGLQNAAEYRRIKDW